MDNQGVGWPSAFVALGLLGLIASIVIAAIVRYDVDDVLKLWTAMTTLIGVVTGSFVTYFFTRSAVQDAKQDAALSRGALTNLAGRMEPTSLQNIISQDETLATALGRRSVPGS